MITCKISDFGHSVDVSEVESHPDIDPSLHQEAYRSSGVYSAPETWHLGSIQYKACDIWDLGCISSEVVTFIWGGPNDVSRFRLERTSETNQVVSDVFHDTKRLKSEVLRWLYQLKARTVDLQ